MRPWRLEELAPGVFARTGTHPLQPNSGIIVGTDGVLVIDSGYSTAAGRELLGTVQRVTPLPVTAVAISHHHFDHAWGNDAFAGATLLGHENARRNMTAEPEVYRERMVAYTPTSGGWYGVAADELARQFLETQITPPAVTFTGQMNLDFAGQRVELLHLGPGHTDGDTVVHLPDLGVVFGGDLICNHVFPNAMDGDPLHWPKVLEAVQGLDVEWIVPGHGPVGGRRVVAEFDACLDMLTSEVRRALDDGAPDPRAASEHLRLGDLGDWDGAELLPGTVRSMFRALQRERT